MPGVPQGTDLRVRVLRDGWPREGRCFGTDSLGALLFLAALVTALLPTPQFSPFFEGRGPAPEGQPPPSRKPIAPSRKPTTVRVCPAPAQGSNLPASPLGRPGSVPREGDFPRAGSDPQGSSRGSDSDRPSGRSESGASAPESSDRWPRPPDRPTGPRVLLDGGPAVARLRTACHLQGRRPPPPGGEGVSSSQPGGQRAPRGLRLRPRLPRGFLCARPRPLHSRSTRNRPGSAGSGTVRFVAWHIPSNCFPPTRA